MGGWGTGEGKAAARRRGRGREAINRATGWPPAHNSQRLEVRDGERRGLAEQAHDDAARGRAVQLNVKVHEVRDLQRRGARGGGGRGRGERGVGEEGAAQRARRERE